MDGVLEGAVLLCACKLACSFPFLPWLAATCSPVSFCCCCLLFFTDFLLTVVLSFISILEFWQTELSPPGDVIALRFLLFLNHTYGAVLLLTTFLITVETLIRLLWPLIDADHRAANRTLGFYVGNMNVQEGEESSKRGKDKSSDHLVGFLCCLSVWVTVALNASAQWNLKEAWAAACLDATNSLVRCLPRLLSPMPSPSPLSSCWSMAFLFFLLLLIISTRLQRQDQPHAWTKRTQGDCGWQDLAPSLSEPFNLVYPGMNVSELEQCVDPRKATNSHTDHVAFSWNNVQMLARHHGDSVISSTDCVPDKRRGKAQEEAKTVILLTFITEEHVDSQPSSQRGWQQWGFPSLQVNVMIVGVLSILVLPFNLSVNILLIRTIDTLLEQCIKSLLSSAANSRDTTTSPSVTKV